MFSIVIPVYNRPDLLREALRSVFAQEFTDYEVIVVDDGSTEDVAKVVAEFGDRVKLLRQPNQGPSAARNLGIANASGLYAAFLDSDDVWFPWTLTIYRDVIDTTGQPAFVTGRPVLFHDKLDCAAVHNSKLEIEAFPDYLASSDQWRWHGVSSFVVRRTAFLAAGGFASARCNAEDADLALKLGVAAGFVHIKMPVTFAYRQHAIQLTHQLAASGEGVLNIVANESAGRYPGERSRADQRLEIITRHIRPVSLDLLSHHQWKAAWRLYLKSAGWHVRLGRWRFLLGFPLRCLKAAFTRAA